MLRKKSTGSNSECQHNGKEPPVSKCSDPANELIDAELAWFRQGNPLGAWEVIERCYLCGIVVPNDVLLYLDRVASALMQAVIYSDDGRHSMSKVDSLMGKAFSLRCRGRGSDFQRYHKAREQFSEYGLLDLHPLRKVPVYVSLFCLGHTLVLWDVWLYCRAVGFEAPPDVTLYIAGVAERLLEIGHRPLKRVNPFLRHILGLGGKRGARSAFNQYYHRVRDLDLAIEVGFNAASGPGLQEGKQNLTAEQIYDRIATNKASGTFYTLDGLDKHWPVGRDTVKRAYQKHRKSSVRGRPTQAPRK